MTKNNEYKSDHEKYFSWWLDDLSEAGIVVGYDYEPTAYQLSDKVTFDYKNKDGKIKEKILLQEHVYTPDFKISWNPKRIDIPTSMGFFNTNNTSVIEIKPAYNMNNMNRLFSVNQKWVYEKYGEYVQKIVVDTLFESTFIPKKYVYTDKSGKLRKIKHEHILLKEYLSGSEVIKSGS